MFEAEGIQRKGMILATLSKLKQVCNHPAQFLGDKLWHCQPIRQACKTDGDARGDPLRSARRPWSLRSLSGWATFSSGIYRRRLAGRWLFLHGGVPKGKRDLMWNVFRTGAGTDHKYSFYP